MKLLEWYEIEKKEEDLKELKRQVIIVAFDKIKQSHDNFRYSAINSNSATRVQEDWRTLERIGELYLYVSTIDSETFESLQVRRGSLLEDVLREAKDKMRGV